MYLDDTGPSTLCPTCARPLHADELQHTACARCLRAMTGWLQELPAQMVVLRGSRHREVGEMERVGGSRTAPLPGRLDVLNLLGPASPEDVTDKHGDQTGPLPIAGVLAAWVRHIAEERRLNGPSGRRTEEQLAAWLQPHLPWACRQIWADEMHNELQQMMRCIRGITRVRPRTVALNRPCPRETCGALGLTATDWQQYVECAVCGGLYTESELLADAPITLARLHREAQETAA